MSCHLPAYPRTRVCAWRPKIIFFARYSLGVPAGNVDRGCTHQAVQIRLLDNISFIHDKTLKADMCELLDNVRATTPEPGQPHSAARAQS